MIHTKSSNSKKRCREPQNIQIVNAFQENPLFVFSQYTENPYKSCIVNYDAKYNFLRSLFGEIDEIIFIQLPLISSKSRKFEIECDLLIVGYLCLKSKFSLPSQDQEDRSKYSDECIQTSSEFVENRSLKELNLLNMCNESIAHLKANSEIQKDLGDFENLVDPSHEDLNELCKEDYDNINKTRHKIKEPKIANVKDYKHKVYYSFNKQTARSKRSLICDFPGCGMRFTKSWNLLDHARTHTGERPHKCDICGLCFTQKGNLNKHRKLHDDQTVEQRKIYKCEYCEKSYTEKFNLNVHMKKHKDVIISIRKKAKRPVPCQPHQDSKRSKSYLQ